MSSAKSLYTILSVLAIVALLAVALPKPALAAVCDETITIEAGDSIYKLAKEYETTVNKIARANDLEKPYVLTPGMTLCIPAPKQPSSNYTWAAALSGNNLTITGEKFKKSHPFIIKARVDPTDAWTKLGRAGSDKDGEMNTKFNLPRALQGETFLTVCLKDGVTDYLDCKRVVRQ